MSQSYKLFIITEKHRDGMKSSVDSALMGSLSFLILFKLKTFSLTHPSLSVKSKTVSLHVQKHSEIKDKAKHEANEANEVHEASINTAPEIYTMHAVFKSLSHQDSLNALLKRLVSVTDVNVKISVMKKRGFLLTFSQ